MLLFRVMSLLSYYVTDYLSLFFLGWIALLVNLDLSREHISIDL